MLAKLVKPVRLLLKRNSRVETRMETKVEKGSWLVVSQPVAEAILNTTRRTGR